MHRLGRRFALLVAAMGLVSGLGLAVQADATLLPGPGASLTYVESPRLARTSRLYASTGSLQEGMSAPVAISEPGDNSGLASLAGDSAGDVLAVWDSERNYEGFDRYDVPLSIPRGIWYAWKSAGGVFGPPQQLVAPAPGQGQPRVAMDPSGEAVVGYEDRGSVFIRRARANGAFGAAEPAMQGSLIAGSYSGWGSTWLDFVGLSNQGELLVVTHRERTLEMRLAAPGGGLSPPQVAPGPSQVSGREAKCCTGPHNVVAAMGSRGDAVVAWEEYVNHPSGGVTLQTNAAYRPAGERFGPTQHLTSPESGPASASPTEAVVDGQGHAILAMIGLRGPQPIVNVSESDASGVLSTPAFVGTNSDPSYGPSTISLAENADDEAALRYAEASGGSTGGYPFTVFVRFRAGGEALGPPQTLKSGTKDCYELVTGGAQRSYGCSALPTLVGAPEKAFYAVYGFEREGPGAPRGWEVLIQRLTREGTGPSVRFALPQLMEPEPEPAPASVVDFGDSTQADFRGHIHGHVTCGNHGGGEDNSKANGWCSIGVTIRDTNEPRLLLARTDLRVQAITPHPVTIVLDQAAKRLMAHHRVITALLVTRTANGARPPTETDYPLTITAPTRRTRQTD